MSDKNSAYAALNTNNSERDRAKDVEQLNDVENRFGNIRDEEKMLTVKKLMQKSPLRFRFRGTRLKYEELLIVMSSSSTRSRQSG